MNTSKKGKTVARHVIRELRSLLRSRLRELYDSSDSYIRDEYARAYPEAAQVGLMAARTVSEMRQTLILRAVDNFLPDTICQ